MATNEPTSGRSPGALSPLRIRTLAVGPLAANCYILVDPAAWEGCIIDPGAQAERILAELEAAARPKGCPPLRVRYVLATHAHFDHVGAAGVVRERTGAPFLLHADDLELLRLAPDAAELFVGERLPPPPEPDGVLADGQRLPLGGVSLEVRHTPGHSPGSVSLVVEAEVPLVFTGDALFAGSIGRTDLPGGDHGRLLDSIRSRLLSLEDRAIVYPGHGPTTTIGHERRTNPFLA